MAEIRGVWGIDIGLSGLKAIRLVYAEAAKQVLATAFDYVPHPKILSQPDANPDELIAQALDTFLSRNSLRGDGVAISVPGHTALARFIQLPPVEASKVVEIVKYEARQQIPFALDEVIWDYQPLGGGVEESGFLLDAKVGLFAMKRDQVQQHLSPFLQRKIEVDLVQIAPLALYNFLCHDILGAAPGKDAPAEQEEYTLVLDMGADNTTLLVSNGKDIWIRNVPLGGNHFTRALTKEMKLTFAKAEHLKVNATKAPDPKAVFQALRPVFNDYVAEIQRSIGFFSSVNRDAKIGKIVGVGNGFKLAGLQKFLQQNLQMDVDRIEAFPALAGDSVLNAPLFQENLLSFAVPYGLALQGLKITRVHTSLLPPEITTARLIRKKKPWAVATAASLMLGLAASTMGYAHVWSAVSTDRFGAVETKAGEVIKNKESQKSGYDTAVKANKALQEDLARLVEGAKGRTHWLELYKAINECLPRDFGDEREQPDPTKRNRIRIMSITATKMDEVSQWFDRLPDNAKTHMSPSDREKGPSGKGYIIRLEGRHFHQGDKFAETQVPYVVNTLLANLKKWKVEARDPNTGESVGEVAVRQLGITHPTIAEAQPTTNVIWYPDGPGSALSSVGGPGVPGIPRAPAARSGRGRRDIDADADAPVRPGPAVARRPPNPRRPTTPPKVAVGKAKDEGEEDTPKGRPIPQTSFTIEFVWKETPEEDRTSDDPNAEKPQAEGDGANKAPGTPGGPAAGGAKVGGPPK
ncbi:MAG TPA: type IV pilus assembly protein PilM [Planctomycetaceae bacterium]|nr:type IV pilus assembly protein PilM [Planctomycetaceae bacterium]